MTPKKAASGSLLAGIVLLGAFVVPGDTIAEDFPSPAILVVIKPANAVGIVDPGSKKMVGQIAVGDNPHEVVVSSDGKLAFVSNEGPEGAGVVRGRTISIIDIAAQKEIRRVDVGAGSRPHGLWFAAGKLYFTAEGNKLIGCYDPATDQIDWRLGIGQNRTHLLIPTKDLNHIFTSNVDSNSITALDRAPEPADWSQTIIPVGKRPEGIAMSPDEKELWVGQLGDGGISIIDVAQKKLVQTLSFGLNHPIRLRFTLDGKKVLISDDRLHVVVVVDPVTRKEIKRLSDIGKNPESYLMSPDGAYAYVALQRDNSIAIIDLKTLEVAGRIPAGPYPGTMAWVARR